MKPDYGIDAPNVVRNLFLFSLILAALAGFSFLIQSPVWFWIAFLYSFPTAFALFITGCWMLYGIKVTKPRTLLQRKRLMLLAIILEKPNVLLLDEPTNHLDFLTLEAFETALLTSEGAILAVSHDSTFIEKIATQEWRL